MAEDLTCSVCGLPKELCLCEDVKREQTTVTLRTEKRTYGKLVTIVEGVSADMVKQVASELNRRCRQKRRNRTSGRQCQEAS
jgi:translation initiation factor 1